MSASSVLSYIGQFTVNDDIQATIFVPGKSLGVESSTYEKLISWATESLSNLGCKKTTNYYAKIYIDQLLTSSANVPVSQLQLFGTIAMNIAIKVVCVISQDYEHPGFPQISIPMTGLQTSWLEEQTSVLENIPKQTFPTPYCYIRFLRENLPNDFTELLGQTQLIVSYCLLLKEFLGVSPTDVVLAVLLYMSKTELADVQNFENNIGKWASIEDLASVIEKRLFEDLHSESDK